MFWQGLYDNFRQSAHKDAETMVTIELNVAVVIELH